MDDYVAQWHKNRVDWLYELARCDEVGSAAVRVGLLFATFLQPDTRERVRPRYEWLCENAHMSRGTLANAIKELKKAGFLTVETYHAEGSFYSMPFTGDEVWRRSREN